MNLKLPATKDKVISNMVGEPHIIIDDKLYVRAYTFATKKAAQEMADHLERKFKMETMVRGYDMFIPSIFSDEGSWEVYAKFR